MKPIIGIISYPYIDKDGSHTFQSNYKIVNIINEMGGVPIFILPSNSDDFFNRLMLNNPSKEDLIALRRVLNMCNGIIRPGGYYFFPFQIETYKYTLEKDIPYLGICNGMQLMHRTINKEQLIENESEIDHRRSYHEIDIENNTLLYKILGKKHTIVRSFHNYHIPNSNGFIVNSRSKDGYIEGIEKDLTYNMGIQWHPEEDMNNPDSIKIFETFIYKSKMKTK